MGAADNGKLPDLDRLDQPADAETDQEPAADDPSDDLDDDDVTD